MPNKATEYFYKGPVSIKYPSGSVIHSYSWSGKTRSSSPDKALSNLKNQYRHQYGLSNHTPLLFLRTGLEEGGT